MEASVIIPTHNRSSILKRCISALENQTCQDFEIIIVDDGSTDDTKKIISQMKNKKITYIYQEHSQQGVARNKGIEKAKGRYIFFIGDDIIAKEDWIQQHLKTHEKTQGVIVLGKTPWHPELKINRFMDYLAPNGPQFNYGAIKNKEDCGWDFFWTSNISIPKEFLEEEKFDENFRGWGYEDLEIGYRLDKRGFKIVYNPNAEAYHYHSYDSPEDFLKKYEKAAKSAVYFVKKHPELKDLISKNKLGRKYLWMLYLFSIFPFLKKIKKLETIYWKLKRRYYFTEGLKNEVKKN